MPEIINCPQCERKLRVPEELLGQSVKCPTCGTTFTATVASAVPPPMPEVTPALGDVPGQESFPSGEMTPFRTDSYGEDEYNDERHPNSSAEARGWEMVRTGVGLVLAAVFVLIGVGLFGGCLGGMAAVEQARRGVGRQPGVMPNEISAILIVSMLGGLVFMGLNVTGNWFCLGVPPHETVRTFALVSLVLLLGYVALSITWDAMSLLGGRLNVNAMAMMPVTSLGRIIGFLGASMGFAHVIVFLFFLRAVANWVHARALGRSIQSLIVLIGVALLLYFAMMVMVLAGVPVAGLAGLGQGVAQGRGVLGVAFGCIEGLLMLITVLWYIVVLFQIRGAIANFLAGRA